MVRSIFLLLFSVVFCANASIFKEPGSYIEKIERSPEREYYKKYDFQDISNDIDQPKQQYYDQFENKKGKWKNGEQYKEEKDVEYYKERDNHYKKIASEQGQQSFDESYKYKKDKYNSYPKKYDEDYKRYKKDADYSKTKKEDHHENKFRHLKRDPPDHTKVIAMARYVMHEADWASVATVSSLADIKGYPFTNIASMSDGPVDVSTGIPYFYLTPLDFTHNDYVKDNRVTVTVSLAETGYCADQKWDADNPQCARVMLSGKLQRIANTTQEFTFAQNALFSRHPSMAKLPADHHFYVSKLKIAHIVMLDWFGGPKFINVRDYLNFKPPAEGNEKVN